MQTELYIIHIGFLENEAVFEKKMKMVSEARKRKAEACRCREDAKRSLAAGLLLMQVAGEQGYDPNEIRADEKGKLYLPEEKDFFFNLSHSGEYAVCATSHAPVGVDIQEIKEIKERVAERFFLPREAEMIAEEAGKRKQELFFRYWTAKESYLKLTGQGLGQSMKECLVDFEKRRIWDNGDREIFLKEYHCLPGYCITAAGYSERFGSLVKKIYYKL